MPTAKVHNLKNKEVGQVDLSDAVFGVELNEPLIHAAVRNYLANARQGTAATKTRGNVRGGGRKPWRQKGTGRARVASIRSPLWRGGGRVHGPQPRDWSYKIPKKMRRGAMRSALSERLREGNLLIIDDFKIDQPKTREFVEVMKNLGLNDGKKPVKVLIVDSLENENLVLSSRNVQKTKVTNGYGVNIYDLLYHEKLLISKTAVEELTRLLDPAGAEDESGTADQAEKKAQPAKKPAAEKKPAKAKKTADSGAKKSAGKKSAAKKKAPAAKESKAKTANKKVEQKEAAKDE